MSTPYMTDRVLLGVEGPRPTLPIDPTATREAGYEEWGVFNVVVGLATVPVVNTNLFPIKRAVIVADAANLGVIYAAEQSPSINKGIRLAANAALTVFVTNLAKIQLSANLAGQLALVIWYR